MIDFLLFFVATPMLKTFLQDRVLTQTKGLFTLNFENISIELANRRVVLKNFEMIPDSGVYQKLLKEEKNVPALYKISCKSVTLWRLSAYNLFVKSRLKARELKLTDLVIELLQLPNSKSNDAENRDFVHEDLYPSISNYLSELIIDEINVVNGKFNLNLNKNKDKKTTHVGFINIKLYRFLLNRQEYEMRNRLFFADDLQLNIDEYRINLSDNLHYIYAQDLTISTKESKLTAKNSGIAPLNLPQSKDEEFSNNYYKVQAPFIEIDHFNMFELYFNQDINVGKVYIKKPKFSIYNVLRKNKELRTGISKSKELDLSKLIAGKLNSIQVDTFSVDDGKLNFYVNKIGEKPTYFAKSMSLGLYRFQLNAFTSNDLKKILYADDIVLNVKGFSTTLPDKTHSLDVASIDLSTYDKNFRAEGINLHPIDSSTGPTRLKMVVPYIEIMGTDFYKLYHQRIFNISNLELGNSDFELNFNSRKNGGIENEQQKNILTLLTANYLNQLSISNFNLRQSKFKIHTRVNDSLEYNYQGEAAFSLSNLFVDEESLNNPKSKLFYSDQFKLKLDNYQQDLKDQVHQFYAKSVEVSTSDSLIEITGLNIRKKDTDFSLFKGKHTKWIYDFNLIQVSIQGIDINKAYNDSNLVAHSVSVFRPVIRIENNVNIAKTLNIDSDSIGYGLNERIKPMKRVNFRESTINDLLASYFSSIHLNVFNIETADFALFDVDSTETKSLTTSGIFSAILSEFKLLPKDSINPGISYSENISFRVKDYFTKVLNKRYQIKIKEVKYSSKDSVFQAILPRFFPTGTYEKSQEAKSLWTFYSPEISTTRTDVVKLLNNNVLDVGYVSIKDPTIINTKLPRTDSVYLKAEEPPGKKSLPFEKILLSGINIENGNIGIAHKTDKSEDLILKSEIKLNTDAIELDSAALSDLNSLVSGLGALVNFKNIRYVLPDGLHFAKLNSLNINTRNKVIEGDSLNYFPLLKLVNFQEKPGLEECSVPKILLYGMDIGKLLINKSIRADSLKLQEPFLGILGKEKASSGQKSALKLPDLNDKIKKQFKGVEIGKISFDDAKISFCPAKETIRQSKLFEKVNVDIHNFVIDSANTNKNKILNADNIKASINDYFYHIPNSIYNITFKELGFSTAQKSLFARGLNLNPIPDRNEYVEMRQKETSLSYFRSNDLLAKGMDFNAFLQNGDMVANELDIIGAQYHVYKNKQYPLDSVIRPSLPHEFIFKFPELIKIDTINVRNSYFANDVLNQNAKEPGLFELTKINGQIFNFTNSKKAIENGETTNVLASAYFMDKSLLTASFHFPLKSEYGEYYYGGELDSFDLKEINPFLENMVFVSVTDGEMQNLKFNVSANSDFAEGNVNMIYKNLKVDFLNKKKTDSLEVDKRGLFSMLANSVIRNSNPKRKGGFVKEGRIYYERNNYKSVYNYWAMSILSGMKSTLGFKSKQLKERLKIEKIANRFTQKSNKKTARSDRKVAKAEKKQIEKELKQEQRLRKRNQRKSGIDNVHEAKMPEPLSSK